MVASVEEYPGSSPVQERNGDQLTESPLHAEGESALKLGEEELEVSPAKSAAEHRHHAREGACSTLQSLQEALGDPVAPGNVQDGHLVDQVLEGQGREEPPVEPELLPLGLCPLWDHSLHRLG